MPEYRMFIDEKHTVWQRIRYVVTADSPEEAKKLLTEEFENPSMSELPPVKFLECETLYDTLEPLTPKENDGQSTREAYDHDAELITDNATE